MRRAGKQLVAIGLLLGWSGASWAYHTGSVFDDAPGAGGAGGLFYVASPRERGWTCSACHVQRGGEINVSVVSPLFDGEGYVPDTTYTITITLQERFGIGAGLSNHNGLAVATLDANNAPAGDLGGFVASDFHSRGDNIIATSGFEEGLTEWSFDWTAPPAGTGTVGFYLGVVDGDGAGTAPTVNTTDPFGDGVFMFERLLPEL